MKEPTPQLIDPDDQPPIFGSWRNLYIVVLVFHAILIAVLYGFTQSYS